MGYSERDPAWVAIRLGVSFWNKIPSDGLGFDTLWSTGRRGRGE